MTSLVAVLSVIGLAVSLAIRALCPTWSKRHPGAALKPFKAGDYVEAGGISVQ